MEKSQILDLLKDTGAILKGHFLLSSGKHSGTYVQCAKLLRYADKSGEVLEDVAKKVAEFKPDILVGPALGGIIVAYEIGRQIGVESIFAERHQGEMTIRRGFEIKKGQRVVICEDVVTTAKSSYEVKKVVDEMGGEVVAFATIVDRTSKELELPLLSAYKFAADVYEPEDCLVCQDENNQYPLVKPGSRVKM